MSGENDLSCLVGSMKPTLTEGVYVYVTAEQSHNLYALKPKLLFEEAEGITAIVSEQVAKDQGLDFIFPCRMITLDIHSSLEAVGFMAAVASRLAECNIGVNPVAGYFHDHLFVAVEHARIAVLELEALAQEYQ